MARAASVCLARKAASAAGQIGAVVGHHGNRKERCVRCTSGANRKGSDWNAFGHLHNAVQRVHAIEVFGGDRHTQHGHRRFRCQHAGQVRRATRTRDDGLQPSLLCGVGVGKQIIGHAMGRDHPAFESNPELGQYIGGRRHGVPVAAGTHHNTNLNRGHAISVKVVILRGVPI